MFNRVFSRVAVVVFAIGTLLAGAVQAQTAPNFKLKVEWGTNTWNSNSTSMHLTPDPTNPNGWHFDGGTNQTDWQATWNGSLDVDPALNSAIAFTNNSAVNQTFIATLTLPTVGAITAPSTILGGTTVSVSGAGVVQTASAPAGDFVYRAATGSGGFVGAPADLLPPPFSITTGPLGLPNSAGPFNYGPANGPGLLAADSISIRHAFTLTPGASATLNGTFVIVVPEPTSLALLPLVAVGIVRRRRN